MTGTNAGLSDTQYTIRKQFIGTTVGNAVTFNAGAGETFAAFAERDYTLSVLTTGGGAHKATLYLFLQAFLELAHLRLLLRMQLIYQQGQRLN